MFFRIIIAQVFFLSAVMGIFAQPSQEKIEVTTVLKEKFTDKNGNILTGKGVVIGDVDSGVDIFHPMFFFADGGDFKWLDVNSDGSLTFGTDGIDLNNNGSIESNEVLRYIEMRDNTWGLLAGADSKKYNPEYDFIYVDANGNKRRDYGPDKGFSETDPTYGEQLLISVDDNKNGKVDAGEKLVALKTSKVRAVRERDGKVRRRGVDLIYTEEDSSGHGTGVAGLILGGTYGVQKIQGLAPEAELVVSCIKYDYTPRFVRNFVDYLNFLKEEKVNILLIEDGEWMYEFMDGSSPEEQILNQMASDGVTIVGGAGNLTSGNMLIMDTLSAGKQASYKAEAPYITEGKPNDGVFFSFLWPNTNTNIEFTIETPEKNKVELSSGSGLVKSGSYNIYYAKETSPKGTVMFRFGCSKTDSSAVNGTWKFTLNPDGEAFIRGYVVDVSQSWSGNSHWKDTPKITDESTVCFPSTADSCMAVGAYVVNFGWMDKVGDIASYSSKGFTITGKLGIDITGPGHSTITTEKDYSYQMFSGTSAAAPHVVGAAALLLQYQHGLTHTQIRKILLNSATQDNFTGPVPNPTWGYGKINIEEAIKFLINNSN